MKIGSKLMFGWIALAVITLSMTIAVALWVYNLNTPVMLAGNPTATTLPDIAAAPTANVPPETGDSQTPASNTSNAPKSPTPSATPTPEVSYVTSDLAIPPKTTAGKQHRYFVESEISNGMRINNVAEEIANTLNNPRSWSGRGTLRFGLTPDFENADFSISFNSEATTRTLCGKKSICKKDTRIVISITLWNTPAASYADDASAWQRYLVNYGAGLYLGKKSESCPKKGKLAPIMQDQSKDLRGCLPNSWVY